MKKYVMVAVTVAGVLAAAAFLFIGPTLATHQPDAPTNTAMAQPAPEPTLTPAEFDEFVDSVCNNVEVWLVSSYQEDDQLYLEWEAAAYEGPHVGPRYDGHELTFRIERRPGQKGDVSLRLVADVTGDRSWNGKGESGDWFYRVALYSVTHEGRTQECPGEPAWDGAHVSFYLPPTPEELAAFANDRCNDLEVVNLDGSGDWDYVWLSWDTNAHDLDLSTPSPIYAESLVNFRIEWRPAGTTGWRLAEQVDGGFLWDSGISWGGDSDPGRSVYRVAVSSITIGKQTVQCQGELRWAELPIKTPTAEERAQVETEREVLVAEATRCLQDALTSNISEAALPTVKKYLKRLVAEEIAGPKAVDGNDELAWWTLTVCSMGSDESGAASLWWLMLFGGF